MSIELCCNLAAHLVNKEEVLYETNNFVVTPTLGQFGVEGYLLICSKKHYIGTVDIPREIESELEEVIDHTKDVLHSIYGVRPYVFEHGPKLEHAGGGVTVNHMHLHVIPVEVEVDSFLQEISLPNLLNSFDILRQLTEQRRSYLWVETPHGCRTYVEVAQQIPSQYLRKRIAEKLGREDWNLRQCPDYVTFQNTLRTLKGKF